MSSGKFSNIFKLRLTAFSQSEFRAALIAFLASGSTIFILSIDMKSRLSRVIIEGMSGHSKWSTIKRAKEANDKARGKVFSKHSKAISVAVKTGGGEDPVRNSKLRVAIDSAKSDNMPKLNIERAIKAASKIAGNLEEISYEGFLGGGVNVIVEAATDNRNRSAQEIKGILEKDGGTLSGPGTVSYNYDTLGLLLIQKKGDFEEMSLAMIDLGAIDIEESDDGVEVYFDASGLSAVRKKVEGEGYKVIKMELVKRPKNLVKVTEESRAKRYLKILTELEGHDDVQKVFANLDIVTP